MNLEAERDKILKAHGGAIKKTLFANIVRLQFWDNLTHAGYTGIHYQQEMEPAGYGAKPYTREGILIDVPLNILPSRWTKTKGHGHNRHQTTWFVDEASGKRWYIAGWHETGETVIIMPAEKTFADNEEKLYGPKHKVYFKKVKHV